MKHLFLLLLISAITFISCSSEKEYPVKITEENGVKTISNPDYPKEGVYDLVLDELFTLGKDEDNSKYIFALPIQINLDSKLNLYVLDWDNFKFFVFDKDGKYLRQFGRRGQGPGDFDTPSDFKMSKDDKIILNDGRNLRISILDSTGKYLSGFPDNRFHTKLEIDSKDNLYTDEIERDMSKLSSVMQQIPLSRIVLNYSKAEKKWIPIEKFSGEVWPMKRTQDGGITGGDRKNAFFWKIAPGDNLITGFEDKYEFSTYSLDGKILNKYGRIFSPYRNPDYKEGTMLLPYLPVFTRFSIFDDNGNFWVNINNGRKPKVYIYDIYSENGIFQKQVYSKYRITLFMGDRIYSVVRSETDPVYVKAFKYSLKKREK